MTDSQRPPDSDDEEVHDGRKRVERLMREVFRKALEKGLEAGVGTLSKADKTIRGVVDDVPLPKEMVGYVFAQVEESKDAVVRVVGREVREFLEKTDVAGELQRALTSLSFEVKTEVRFIPNDSGGIKPQVRARAAPKVKRTTPPPEDDSEA